MLLLHTGDNNRKTRDNISIQVKRGEGRAAIYSRSRKKEEEAKGEYKKKTKNKKENEIAKRCSKKRGSHQIETNMTYIHIYTHHISREIQLSSLTTTSGLYIVSLMHL